MLICPFKMYHSSIDSIGPSMIIIERFVERELKNDCKIEHFMSAKFFPSRFLSHVCNRQTQPFRIRESILCNKINCFCKMDFLRLFFHYARMRMWCREAALAGKKCLITTNQPTLHRESKQMHWSKRRKKP